MGTDAVLGLLGLARRAGKLACGDDPVRNLCASGQARCVFLAADAGNSITGKVNRYVRSVPLLVLPYGKAEIGGVTGRADCAVCAVSDTGMAAAAVQKLALGNGQYAAVAEQLAEKNARIQSRRGKKKRRPSDGTPPRNRNGRHVPALTGAHKHF